MKTKYISRKRLIADLGKIDDYFIRNSADYVLATYPHCKYYIYDGSAETFKPSKRK